MRKTTCIAPPSTDRIDPPPTLLPLSSMARKLRVPTRWLRAEADAGRVPCVRAESRLLFDPVAVAAVLAERATRPDPATKGVDHVSR